MAANEHLNLSTFIKSVHHNLRSNAKTLGSGEAWRKHIGDEENLKKYAETMHKLAVDHWESRHNQDSRLLSRVTWVYNICKEYFFGQELARQREKEQQICNKIGRDRCFCNLLHPDNCLKLLDVGSCYNPFRIFDCFDVVAVDIAPATDTVIKFDFLNLNVVNEETSIDRSSINELKENCFHIVVFSLLLEYLPDPKQRLICCEKAYTLLKSEGILIIITPDSNHVGANAKYMKSWRYVLAKLGFSRIKYEKLPHLHCMAFRKNLLDETAIRWAKLHQNKDLFEELFIPQDFHCENTPALIGNIDSVANTNTFVEIEGELPFSQSEDICV